jgi:hypothetical protein
MTRPNGSPAGSGAQAGADVAGLNDATAEELRSRFVSPNGDLGPGPYDGVEIEAFVCECASESCAERVRISLRSFERIRESGCRVVAPGHDLDSTVVRRQPAFWIVREAAPAAAGNRARAPFGESMLEAATET